MGAPAERALTAWAREGPVVKRREAIRCLAGFRSRRVIRCLRRLLRDPDAAIRADAALALRVIDPHKAAGWLSGRPEADRSPAAGTRRLP
jgi:hypothetical protein